MTSANCSAMVGMVCTACLTGFCCVTKCYVYTILDSKTSIVLPDANVTEAESTLLYLHAEGSAEGSGKDGHMVCLLCLYQSVAVSSVHAALTTALDHLFQVIALLTHVTRVGQQSPLRAWKQGGAPSTPTQHSSQTTATVCCA